MRQFLLFPLFLCTLVASATAASRFADAVVNYDPGVGYVPGFTHPESVLGEPARSNPFGEPTDPFNPPYGTNQIISIGAGGHITVRFDTPVLNHRHNLYGLDFTIFGNAGFIITNEFDFNIFDWIGTPATDGSLFAQSTGPTEVWVSRDGNNWYLLVPPLPRSVDGFPPTDGAGDPHVPVLPQLVAEDFAGATLEDIRLLYQGSAGGTSYDLSWAQDAEGQAVFLQEVNFVQVVVLSGKAEVDAIAAVARRAGGKGAQP